MSAAALQLDFRQPAPPAWRAAGWVLLALVVAGAWAFSEHSAEVSQRHAAAQSRHARLSESLRSKAPRRAAVAADPQTLADVQRANRIIDQLTVPWDALFNAVEGADARGVAVMSLTPNALEHSLRLAGEARALPELLAYVGRLAEQPGLGQVHLLGYNTTARDGVPVLSFTVAATWRQQP